MSASFYTFRVRLLTAPSWMFCFRLCNNLSLLAPKCVQRSWRKTRRLCVNMAIHTPYPMRRRVLHGNPNIFQIAVRRLASFVLEQEFGPPRDVRIRMHLESCNVVSSADRQSADVHLHYVPLQYSVDTIFRALSTAINVVRASGVQNRGRAIHLLHECAAIAIVLIILVGILLSGSWAQSIRIRF